MAFANTEDFIFDIDARNSSIKRLQGRVTLTGGSTTGTIVPGSPTSGSAAAGSAGLRTITGFWFASISAAPSEIQGVVAYNSTTDRYELTITAGADQVFDYYIEGFDVAA